MRFEAFLPMLRRRHCLMLSDFHYAMPPFFEMPLRPSMIFAITLSLLIAFAGRCRFIF